MFGPTAPRLWVTAATLSLAACGDDGQSGGEQNTKPANIVAVQVRQYDGVSDDLLTGGFGRMGLAAASTPAFVNPSAPTPAELRRTALHENYRALVDTTASGGYGTLYGPNVDASGRVTTSRGAIAGIEYTALSDDGSGRENVSMVVQIPTSFDRARPCIQVVASPGSQGVYGGIAVAEWGLKRGCAVALTDKGTGTVPHALGDDTVGLVDGTRVGASTAGRDAVFRAELSMDALAGIAGSSVLAMKHPHSQRNPERDWGRFTLQAVEFAFYALNDRFGTLRSDGTRSRIFGPDDTIVIASSTANGAAAALAAAEQDDGGLIDGIAVAQPRVEMPPDAGVTVRSGATTIDRAGRTAYDSVSLLNLYGTCAALAPGLAGSPGLALLDPATGAARCRVLQQVGLLTESTTTAQAAEALERLHRAGFSPQSDALYASLSALDIPRNIAVTDASAYARASVADDLCNFRFAIADPADAPTQNLAALYATGNGSASAAGADPGVALQNLSLAAFGADGANASGALCLRELFAPWAPFAATRHFHYGVTLGAEAVGSGTPFKLGNSSTYRFAIGTVWYDDRGIGHSIELFFVPVSPTVWEVYVSSDDMLVTAGASATLTFGADGRRDPAAAPIALRFPTGGSTGAQVILIDLGDVVLQGHSYSLRYVGQDGYGPDRIAPFARSRDGRALGPALLAGIAETYRNGNLRGKPTVIVHGRDDGLVPVNHASRPYLAMNRAAEGDATRLSYIEVTNAQHFDAFIGRPTMLPGYDTRYVPLHLYLMRALDAVYANLTEGLPLPASQVVRTTPRGGRPGAAPAITGANVPPFFTTPAAADAITVSGRAVTVPD